MKLITLLFNRPDARNALSLEMRSLLRDSLMDAEMMRLYGVVLKGTGGHFMAGGDAVNERYARSEPKRHEELFFE